MNWQSSHLNRIINQALDEDIRSGDLTSEAVIKATQKTKAVFRPRESGVLAGNLVVQRVFAALDPQVKFCVSIQDGDYVKAKDAIATVEGNARSILAAERVALNFLRHLSGIASRTRRFVELTKVYPVRIVDTRKTTPGLRCLEKYAVTVGGAWNHRFGLDDGILIKDNHIVLAGGIANAVAAAKYHAPHLLKIQVEVENLDEVREALASGADMLLLDNMDPGMLRKAVRLVDKKVPLEASGNITEKNVQQVADTGIDFISVGCLTHSHQALDIGLDIL